MRRTRRFFRRGSSRVLTWMSPNTTYAPAAFTLLAASTVSQSTLLSTDAPGGTTVSTLERLTVLRVVGDYWVKCTANAAASLLFSCGIAKTLDAAGAGQTLNPNLAGGAGSDAQTSWMYLHHFPMSTSSTFTFAADGPWAYHHVHIDVKVKRVMRANERLSFFRIYTVDAGVPVVSDVQALRVLIARGV